MAGAYTDKGLMEDPGGRKLPVARFKPRLTVFSPIPPAMATTSPVELSTMVMADWSCCPLLDV